MKHLIAAALLVFGAAQAQAQSDCAAELARVEGGISKDGSLAPLQEPAEGVAKDGGTAPLNASPEVATSPADVAAQQQGEPTAAEQAQPDRDEAIARAREAMAAGDEQGCMDALRGLSAG